MKKILLFFVILGFGLLGCGSDTGTSGTLTMTAITATDLTGGTYQVGATATYAASDSSKVATGAVIDFTAVYTTPSSTTPVTRTSKYKLGSSGIASYTDVVQQGSEPIYLRLTSSISGLSQTQIATIPAIAALSVSPAAISFANTDTAGTTKTITVAGGFSPYTVASATPADVDASVSGTSVTLTLMATGTTTKTSTTVTVTDTRGNSKDVVVGYFK